MRKQFHTALGKKIRGIRKNNKLSQESFSEKCGLSVNEIGRIERGERSPSLNTMLNICEGLETPIHEMFYGIQEYSSEEGRDPVEEPSIEDLKQTIASLISTQDMKKLQLYYKILLEITNHD